MSKELVWFFMYLLSIWIYVLFLGACIVRDQIVSKWKFDFPWADEPGAYFTRITISGLCPGLNLLLGFLFAYHLLILHSQRVRFMKELEAKGWKYQ